MDTRPPIEGPPAAPVLSVAFNDGDTHFAIGLNDGFAVHHADSGDLEDKRTVGGGVSVVQMLGISQYSALVGGGLSPTAPSTKVMIWDNNLGKAVLEISTLTPIRGVRLSKKLVVVVLKNEVRTYAFAKHPKPQTMYETADNESGLCCLTEKYLVFPGRTAGQVQSVHLSTDDVSIIPAHNSSLQALQLSQDGKLLATASEKGTIVRIFSMGTCAKVAERRRGSDQATIFSLRFNPSGTILACTSDKGSLHVFDVSNDQPTAPQSQSPGTVGSTADGAKNGWGFLRNIPFGPFTDTYSFASTQFYMDDDHPYGQPSTANVPNTTLGISRAKKGALGWIDDKTVVVVGAGKDPRWEKFLITQGPDGRTIAREGWKNYVEP